MFTEFLFFFLSFIPVLSFGFGDKAETEYILICLEIPFSRYKEYIPDTHGLMNFVEIG